MSLTQRFARFYRILRIHLLAFLGYLVLMLIYKSLRWENASINAFEKWLALNNPKIGAFWHDRQLMIGLVFSAQNRKRHVKRVVVLISRSDDGRIIAQVMRYLGIDSVEGSSSRGGAVALMQLRSQLDGGSSVVITPDGPRGPARKMKSGIIRLAQQSGRPVCPVAYGVKKSWKFNSWDGMFLPKPFSRAVVCVGEQIFVPAQISSEEAEFFRLKVEAELNRVTDLADRYEYA